MSGRIKIETTINAPVGKVWECYTEPRHITGWAFVDPSWEAPRAENDLRVGGRFLTRMQPKTDPNQGFDFTGTYTVVEPGKVIEYDMDKAPEDAAPRHVKTTFEEVAGGTKVTLEFDPENVNPLEMQRQGWQGILNNFKSHTESC